MQETKNPQHSVAIFTTFFTRLGLASSGSATVNTSNIPNYNKTKNRLYPCNLIVLFLTFVSGRKEVQTLPVDHKRLIFFGAFFFFLQFCESVEIYSCKNTIVQWYFEFTVLTTSTIISI